MHCKYCGKRLYEGEMCNCEKSILDRTESTTRNNNKVYKWLLGLLVLVILIGGAFLIYLFQSVVKKDVVENETTPTVQVSARTNDSQNPTESTKHEETDQVSNDETVDINYKPKFDMTSASDYVQLSPEKNYEPGLVLDGNPVTAWNCTGTSDIWIELSSSMEQKVSGIRLLSGYTKYSLKLEEWLYYKNHRPKNITVSFSDGTAIDCALQDVFNKYSLCYQDINFGGVKNTKFIRISINDVYMGDRYNDTCISEIDVY